ncbi:MAG: YqgE/AlgH family protein [Nostocoides sp.]
MSERSDVRAGGGTRTTGRLLLATPRIDEGVFFRAVVLVLQHDEDGAQGVVLNRPLDADVDAVLPGWQMLASAPGTVFHGGPVQLDTAIGLVFLPGSTEPPEGIRRLFGAIGVVDLDSQPEVLVAQVARMRVFAGYAGWSSQQLETEIATGSWFVLDAEADDVFTADPRQLWSHVLRRQSGKVALLATLPDDPELN